MSLSQERVKAEILNKKLRRQLAEYKVPPVLNYVHEKVAVHDLENTLRIWERKVEIAEVGHFWMEVHLMLDRVFRRNTT